MKRFALLALLIAMPCAAIADAGVPNHNSHQPIDVNADDSIEWHQNEKAYVARGNASAQQGDLTVYGDVLTAYYRDLPDGGTEIFRLSSEGHVRMTSPTQEVFGEHGVYDVDRQVVVVTGDNLKMVTPNDVITARDTLEYWDGPHLGVARGNAIDVRQDDRVRADILVAQFSPDAKGQLQLTRVDGSGDVVVTTPTDVAQGNYGVYDVVKDITTLTGPRVTITRGQSELDGTACEVNMKTGMSRMLPTGGPTGTRVHGLFVPGQPAGQVMGGADMVSQAHKPKASGGNTP